MLLVARHPCLSSQLTFRGLPTFTSYSTDCHIAFYMPSYLSSAASSRIRKPGQPSSLRRHSSSPFSSAPRVKSIQRTKSLADAYEDETDDQASDRLEATGIILSTVSVATAVDVWSAVQYSSQSMFSAIPERAGMNSVRIAEVLNFQRNLPALVSLAHVHALVTASSKTERDISSAIAIGKVRKITVIGRGNDISGTGELLMTTVALEALMRHVGVAQDVASDCLKVLRLHPRATTLSQDQLPVSHLTALTKAGFLVSSSTSKPRNASLSGSSIVATKAISRASSGSSGAIGGDAAFENLGGVGSAKRHGSDPGKQKYIGQLTLSVPNIGPYIRLLHAGRTHLVELLGKSKYREAPLYLLREKWDGAIDNDSMASQAKQIRGEFSGVMPAKTKKWKNLSGLNFDWALEECLGAGLIELFETRSVGLGVRAIG